MILQPLRLAGCYQLAPEGDHDHRGYFTRAYGRRVLEAHDLDPAIVRCTVSIEPHRGTVRGFRIQPPPDETIRFLRCTRGALHVVLLDLRPDSATLRQHLAHTLTRENRLALYIPPGVAHAYQALEDDSEVFCQMSELDAEESVQDLGDDGITWGIQWPLARPASSV